MIISVNQRENGGVWNYLGEFPFTENQTFKVKLISSTDGYCIADALRFYRNTTSIEDQQISVTDFRLFQNFPNPFNSSTNLSFSFKESGLINLKIYNSLGEEVQNLLEGYFESGKIYSVIFECNDLPSGVYFARLIQNRNFHTIKMLLLK